MKSQFPTRLFRAEQKRTTYFEIIPEGMPLEKVLSGDYWAHVRKELLDRKEQNDVPPPQHPAG